MKENTGFGSKIGLLAATIGSAVGLGTIWRFPAIVQEQGGSAFLLVYLICLFVFGVPIMLAEFSLGRAGGNNIINIFSQNTKAKGWQIVGILGLLASNLILPYYMVVAGWSLEYLWHSLSGGLFDGVDLSSDIATNCKVFEVKMQESITTKFSPIFWTYMMILINLIVLVRGVQKGIENLSKYLMPLLFIMLVVLCIVSLSLPNASVGVEFFLKPDFSKITLDMIIKAIGQAFFSLSLGMGILLTYAAYFPKDTKMPSTAVSVSLSTLLIAILMGLIIFPAAASFNMAGDANQLSGTTLVFVTLPAIFTQMQGTYVWALLFFFLLFVATITSTVSIAEVSIAYLCEKFGISRTSSCLWVLAPLFITSALCSLSLSGVSALQFWGISLFDVLDGFTTNYLLPISGIGVCIYLGWVMKKPNYLLEVSNQGTYKSMIGEYAFYCIKYLCPVLLFVLLVSSLIG